jgi:hypothetical protein
MEISKNRIGKSIFKILSAITIVIVLIIIFISPISKCLIEKLDEKYTGRQITMDYAYVNPFTGHLYLNNLKVYELKSDSIFLSAAGLSLNLSLYKLLHHTIEIRMLTLEHPNINFIQHDSIFNFDDLKSIFSSNNNNDTSNNHSHFNILKIKILNGELHYHETQIPINYFIKDLNIESKGKNWDEDSLAAKISFKPGISTGSVKGEFTINLKNHDYNYSVLIQNLDLNIIEQYLRDLTNYGIFRAKLDANLKSYGNFNNAQDLTSTGKIQINDFHFGKNINNDYASFDKLLLGISELSPKKGKYIFDSLLISHPYFKYELYDGSDNLQKIFNLEKFGHATITNDHTRFNLIIEIGRYVKILARNFFQSYYRINRSEILKGELAFNDYSLSEKFSVELSPMKIIADSIDKNNKQVDVSFSSGIKPYGNVNINLSINPRDTGDFNMQYNIEKIPAALFNPYTITYTSFPLDRGTIEVNGNWVVRKNNINSINHLVLIDPRVTKKTASKDTHWIPMPLIMSFVREQGNVIDYEIPITGNLKDPNFHLHDVISDMLQNIFIKPATVTYRAEVKNIENEIEKSLTIKWAMHSSKLTSTQEDFMNKMVNFLVKNPDASITITPQVYTLKEKEYILLSEAKKKYYLLLHHIKADAFTSADSEKVIKMSVKDTLFIKYLRKLVNDSLVFTIQEKCSRIIDSSFVNNELIKLNVERKKVFLAYFEKKKVDKQIHFSKAENVIPYNGFSFYKIYYSGETPEPLIKAYNQMSELNDKAPREKFKSERKNRIPL